MTRLEYKITCHPSDTFREVAYFCSEHGECNLEKVSGHQIKILENILNEKGLEGWELVQVNFGKEGVVVFWKRMIKNRDGIGEEVEIEKAAL